MKRDERTFTAEEVQELLSKFCTNVPSKKVIRESLQMIRDKQYKEKLKTIEYGKK